MIEIKAYKCGFEGCKKYLKTKYAMVVHEKNCLFNPKSRSCFSCRYDGKETTDNGAEGYMFQKWTERFCEIEKRSDEQIYVRDCPFWHEKQKTHH